VTMTVANIVMSN